MDNLTLGDFKQLHQAFEDDVSSIWDYEKSIENRCSLGGTSKQTVQDQIVILSKWLDE